MSIRTNRPYVGGIWFASFGALIAASIAQHGFGIEPCDLCMWQRYPYGVAMLLVLAAAIVPVPPKGWFVAAAAAVIWVGFGIAVYHVGVQQGFFSAACVGQDISTMSIDQMLGALKPVKPCNEVDWQLWGISLAGFNAIYAAALGTFATIGAWRYLR